MTYLGKRVEVRIPQRSDNTKYNGKFTTCVGICQFLGENEHLSIPLQIVVDRMPVTLNTLKDVKIL